MCFLLKNIDLCMAEAFAATHSSILGLPLWLSWWRIHLQCRRPEFNPLVGKIPWRRERLPTPVFWPGEFHGLYSLWGLKESEMTEKLSLSLWNYHNIVFFLTTLLIVYTPTYDKELKKKDIDPVFLVLSTHPFQRPHYQFSKALSMSSLCSYTFKGSQCHQ